MEELTKKKTKIIQEILSERFPDQIEEQDARNLLNVLDLSIVITEDLEEFTNYIKTFVNQTVYNPLDPFYFDRHVNAVAIKSIMKRHGITLETMVNLSGLDELRVQAILEGGDCLLSELQKILNVLSMTMLPEIKALAHMKVSNSIQEKPEEVSTGSGNGTNVN